MKFTLQTSDERCQIAAQLRVKGGLGIRQDWVGGMDQGVMGGELPGLLQHPKVKPTPKSLSSPLVVVTGRVTGSYPFGSVGETTSV